MTRTTTVLLMLTLALVPLPAAAADLQRHSGVLVAIDGGREMLTLDEMGPWTGELGTTISRRELHLSRRAEVKLIRRDLDGTGEYGWRGGFDEMTLTISALRTGDYVTVATRRRGNDVVVESIEVVRPESGRSQR